MTEDKLPTLADLTVAQVEAIEVMSETSIEKWTSPKSSKAAVLGAILVVIGGKSEAEVGAMTFSAMMEEVGKVIQLG